MSRKTIVQDLTLIDYQKAWDYQESIFQEMIAFKIENKQANASNHLIFCEHPHVFTLGKNGSETHLLITQTELQNKNIALYRTNRGGQITYHGFGQLVCYPIFDLENFGIGLRQYIHQLEEVVILALKNYHIEAQRLVDAPGVWIENIRKICAIGVKSSQMITMHGFALNIHTDLTYFDYINPCGFVDKQTTSIQKETDKTYSLEEIKNCIINKFVEVFGINIS